MLVKHEIRNMIATLGSDNLFMAFSEAVDLFHDSKEVYRVLLKLRSGEMDGMDAADEVEDFSALTVTNLNLFCMWRSSTNMLINRYLDRVFANLKVYSKNLSMASDCLFNILPEELDHLIQQTYNIVSGMVFFCVFEFDILDVLGDSGDIDEVLHNYCARNCIEPKHLAEEFKAATEEFRLKFDVFDSFPELENPFMKIMGPSIVGVDDTLLTLDMVRDVLDGTLSPEGLVEQLNALDEDQEAATNG